MPIRNAKVDVISMPTNGEIWWADSGTSFAYGIRKNSSAIEFWLNSGIKQSSLTLDSTQYKFSANRPVIIGSGTGTIPLHVQGVDDGQFNPGTPMVFRGGNANGNGAFEAGSVVIRGGNQGNGNNSAARAGTLLANGGDNDGGHANNVGADATLRGGDQTAASGTADGGNVTVRGGNVTNSGDGGNVFIAGGTSGSGAVGHIELSGSGVLYGNYHMEPNEFDADVSGASKTLILSVASAQLLELTDNCDLDLSDPQAGGSYVLQITGDGVSDITWPANVVWAQTPPDFTTLGAGNVALVNLYYSGIADAYFGTYLMPYVP